MRPNKSAKARLPAEPPPPPWGRGEGTHEKGVSLFHGNRGVGFACYTSLSNSPPIKRLNAMSDRIFTYGNPQLTANGRQLQRNMTLAERVIWKHLRGKQLGGCKFRRQQPFGIYVLDFVCLEAKLVIEIDGGQHAEQAAYDDTRTRYLEAAGFTVLRFWNNEVLQQTEAVLAAILRRLEAREA